MKRIYINRTPRQSSWGGGNLFLLACHRHASDYGYSIVKHPGESDLILIMDPRPEGSDPGIEQLHVYHNRIPIVHRINEIDSKRARSIGIDDWLRATSQISTLSVFISEWLKQEHNRLGWHCDRQVVCYNGVDRSVFRSYGRKEDPVSIVIHHWSNDPGKGAELHSFLDSFCGAHAGYRFTYIGRPNYQPRHSRVIAPLHGKELAIELSGHTVCINGSKHDPAPNSVFESMAVGLPTYVPAFGGGSIELAGNDHVWSSLDDVSNLLESRSFEPNTKGILMSWEESMDKFFSVLSDILT